MAKFILIVGCNHKLQIPYTTRSDPDEIRVQQRLKVRFAEMMAGIIYRHEIDFIGEEIRHVDYTILQQLSRLAQCYYANIDMPLPVREKHLIPRNYDTYRDVDPEQTNAYDQKRERYMVDRANEFITESTKALIVCGVIHMAHLADLFAPKCHCTKTLNLTNEPWYDNSFL